MGNMRRWLAAAANWAQHRSPLMTALHPDRQLQSGVLDDLGDEERRTLLRRAAMAKENLDRALDWSEAWSTHATERIIAVVTSGVSPASRDFLIPAPRDRKPLPDALIWKSEKEIQSMFLDWALGRKVVLTKSRGRRSAAKKQLAKPTTASAPTIPDQPPPIPDNGLAARGADVAKMFARVPLTKAGIRGLGTKTREHLRAAGITNVGHLAALDPQSNAALRSLIGRSRLESSVAAAQQLIARAK